MNTIKINMNEILERQQIYDKIKIILKEFQENKKDITLKRGIYIYGNPGTGKTTILLNMMQVILEISPSLIRLRVTICLIKISCQCLKKKSKKLSS